MNQLAQQPSKKLARHRDLVMEVENFLLELPQTEIPVRHTFGGGVYMREITIPAETICTGAIHRYETMNVLVSGTIRMFTPDGPKEITGPLTFTSPAGSKNVGRAITDVTWINVMVTDLTDVEEIEQKFLVSDFEALALEEQK